MNIYVGNLSLKMTANELRNLFLTFGEVLSVTIMNDKYIGSGQPRGYGYVEMVSKDEGKNAIVNLEGKILRDRIVNVIEALPLSNKSGMAVPGIRNNNQSNRMSLRTRLDIQAIRALFGLCKYD